MADGMSRETTLANLHVCKHSLFSYFASVYLSSNLTTRYPYFRTIEMQLEAELHGLLSMEIARVRKVEWLSAYVRARARKLTVAQHPFSFS